LRHKRCANCSTIPTATIWDELLAANRALIKAIAVGKPMTRKNARIVAEYLREAGWRDRAIGAATWQTGAYAGTGYAATNGFEGRWRDPVEG
jgi:hypothetical protein